jgi:hypothetical protein
MLPPHPRPSTSPSMSAALRNVRSGKQEIRISRGGSNSGRGSSSNRNEVESDDNNLHNNGEGRRSRNDDDDGGRHHHSEEEDIIRQRGRNVTTLVVEGSGLGPPSSSTAQTTQHQTTTMVVPAAPGHGNEEQDEGGPKFGDVVALRPRRGTTNTNPSPQASADTDATSSSSPLRSTFFPAAEATTLPSSSKGTSDVTRTTTESDARLLLAERKRRNVGVAVLSIFWAVVTYAWQWTHPIEPVQLLYAMERDSTPVTAVGNNGKPTLIEFWAPW